MSSTSYHKLLVAQEGFFLPSPTARYLYAEKKGVPITHHMALEDPVLHEVFEELGPERFCSRLSKCKLAFVLVPKENELQSLELMHDYVRDHEYIQQKHRVWGPESKLEEDPLTQQYRKVALNRCMGDGFKLSERAVQLYARLTKTDVETASAHIATKLRRDDALLIAIIEKLGSAAASGFCSNIVVISIPASLQDWTVEEVEGREWIAEAHLKWLPGGSAGDSACDDVMSHD
jgi:hypothetical protein